MKKYKKSNQRYDNNSGSKNYKFNKRGYSEPKGGTRGCAVKARDGESADQLIKRFKRIVEASGILGELKRREFAMSPSQKVRDKAKRAEKRLRKRMRATQRYRPREG